MKLVPNHHTEMMLQQLQQLQQQLEFGYFEKKKTIFFFNWDFLQPEAIEKCLINSYMSIKPKICDQ